MAKALLFGWTAIFFRKGIKAKEFVCSLSHMDLNSMWDIKRILEPMKVPPCMNPIVYLATAQLGLDQLKC